METPETDWTCARSYKHPKFVRNLALQFWGLRCSRDFPCTHAALIGTAVESGLSCVPDVRTLRQWAHDDDWSGEIARMLRSIAPDIMGGLVVDLIMAASEGMPWLRGVLAGTEPKPNTTRMRGLLTALSMIGVPDLAHGAVRSAYSALGASEQTPAIEPWTDDTSPLDADWKQRIAQRIGHQSE